MADLNFVHELVKGDVIEQVDVLRIMGVDPDQVRDGSMPPDVQLAGMIERELHRNDLLWTVKAHKAVKTDKTAKTDKTVNKTDKIVKTDRLIK